MAMAVADRIKVDRRRTLDTDVARLLRISWQTELAAGFASAFNEPALKRISAQTLPINVYYAMFNMQRAMGRVRGTRLDQHVGAAREFASRASRLPLPWCVTLSGDPDELGTCKLSPEIAEPYAISPIERSHDDAAYLWAALRMARRWKLGLARESWLASKKNRKKDGTKRRRLPSGVRAELAAELRPTTLYDFLWELRRRASYESADEYGSDVDAADFERFYDGLVSCLDTGMLIAETSISRYIGFEAFSAAAKDWMRGAGRVGSWATAPLQHRLAAMRGIS